MSILHVVSPIVALAGAVVALVSFKCAWSALDAVLDVPAAYREAFTSKYGLFKKWQSASVTCWLVALAIAAGATTMLAFTGMNVAAVAAVVAVAAWLLATGALVVVSRLYKRLETEAKGANKATK